VILDNDWAGDPDGLVALAHHLLSPGNRVDLVTSTFLNPVFGSFHGAARGAAMAEELIALIGTDARPPVVAGPEAALADRAPGAAAEAIIDQARRDDDLHLFVVCGGPLTNVAEAVRLAPDIAGRLTLVWIGGAEEDRGFEYNRDTDRAAADLVLATGDLPVWSFPLETYERCACSVAELEHDLRGSGAVGRWLWDRFVTLPLPEGFPVGPTWALGDSPPVLVTALTDASSRFVRDDGSGVERRRYTEVDLRLIVGDLLARLRLHEARRTA
jgi:inosine-uridine nucleoside N-ribohydrolase